jgi:hypothetical protein
MAQPTKKQDPPDLIAFREINAKFKSRIPIILEDISKCLMVIEPAVQDVAVPLREFLDYLEFEMAKVTLQIEKDSWQSVVDINKSNSDKAWLAHLVQLHSDFDVAKMTSSVNFIRDMMKRVRETFDMRAAY